MAEFSQFSWAPDLLKPIYLPVEISQAKGEKPPAPTRKIPFDDDDNEDEEKEARGEESENEEADAAVGGGINTEDLVDRKNIRFV